MMEEQNHERRALLTAVFGIFVSPSVLLSNYTVGPLHPVPQATSLGEGVGMILMLNFIMIGLITLLLVYHSFLINEFDFKLRKIRINKMENL
jgi:hypothetical protein